MEKEKRSISGIYFRNQTPEGKWENRTFEDLSLERQDEVMSGRSVEWLQSLAKSLARTLSEICEEFGITAEPSSGK